MAPRRSPGPGVPVVEFGDLNLARRIYYRQILPLVDMMIRNNNPTGTIKAGLCARRVDVGVPRRPGSYVGLADQKHLERLMLDITQAEVAVAAELATR